MNTDEIKFNVSYSFSIVSKQWFVLAGAVTTGVIHSGMTALIPMNSAFSVPLLIDSIEFVDGKEGSLIGLTYKYEDQDELEILEALGIEDELISVVA